MVEIAAAIIPTITITPSTGGISSEIPHAEVREELKYTDVSINRVSFNCVLQITSQDIFTPYD